MNLKKNTHPRTQRALIITQHIVIIFHLLARRLWRSAHAKKWKIKWEPWKSACIFFSLRWTNKCRMGGGGPGRVWVAKQALGSHWIIQRAGGRAHAAAEHRALFMFCEIFQSVLSSISYIIRSGWLLRPGCAHSGLMHSRLARAESTSEWRRTRRNFRMQTCTYMHTP